MERINKIRYKLLYIWLIFIFMTLLVYYTKQDLFNINLLRENISDHKVLVLLIYLFILTFIGLTAIPSTPFTIAGLLLFPPMMVYFINLIGIITSSFVIYYFTKYLRLGAWLEFKYPSKIEKIKKALRKKELPIIIGWSFIPIAPSDLIIYVSSTLNIPFWKCVLGILIGEGSLIAIYIFSINSII